MAKPSSLAIMEPEALELVCDVVHLGEQCLAVQVVGLLPRVLVVVEGERPDVAVDECRFLVAVQQGETRRPGLAPSRAGHDRPSQCGHGGGVPGSPASTSSMFSSEARARRMATAAAAALSSGRGRRYELSLWR